MAATTYFREKILDLLTGVNGYTLPSQLWVSLHHADPGDGGSHAYEITGGNYSRKSLLSKMSLADANGISVNTVAINFGPASTDWGTVAFIAIEDAASGGNILIPGSPTPPKAVTMGQPFQIAPGNLKIRII
jgi:hypothetical protein